MSKFTLHRLVQLLELIQKRAGDPEVVSLSAPALAAVLRTWPSQTAATFAKCRLLDLLADAIEQQRRMHADQVGRCRQFAVRTL